MNIRSMTKLDIDAVVNVVNSHDDDDGRDARNDFEINGTDTHWVAEVNAVIVGISGYRPVPETSGTGWISWTYVFKNNCGENIGKKLLKHTIDCALEDGAQQLFIKVSNYCDDDNNNIYSTAMKMYESFGFECEIVSKDFYDAGEDQFIYAKNLTQGLGQDVHKENEKPAIRFVDIHEITGTDGAYRFSWEVAKPTIFQKKSFTVKDLNIGLKAVKDQGGRIVFLTFLSNLPLIHFPLSETGFKFIGQLTDYYEPGVHELHFVHNLENF